MVAQSAGFQWLVLRVMGVLALVSLMVQKQQGFVETHIVDVLLLEQQQHESSNTASSSTTTDVSLKPQTIHLHNSDSESRTEPAATSGPNKPTLLETKDPCLIVYHIPKTGGLTMGDYLKTLQQALGWNVTEWYEFRSRYGDQPPDFAGIRNKPQRSFIDRMIHMGHLTPHFETLTQTANCAKMTLLREPVDRVQSAFYYHRHRDKDWPQCLERVKQYPNERCKYAHEYDNDVVRRFANRGSAWNSHAESKYLEGQSPGLDKPNLSRGPANHEKTRLCLLFAQCAVLRRTDWTRVQCNLAHPVRNAHELQFETATKGHGRFETTNCPAQCVGCAIVQMGLQ